MLLIKFSEVIQLFQNPPSIFFSDGQTCGVPMAIAWGWTWWLAYLFFSSFFYVFVLYHTEVRILVGGWKRGKANNIFSKLVWSRSQACKIMTPLKSSEIQSIPSASRCVINNSVSFSKWMFGVKTLRKCTSVQAGSAEMVHPHTPSIIIGPDHGDTCSAAAFRFSFH